MVRVSRGVSFAVAVSVLAGCGAGKVDPVLDLTARPRSIDNLGGKTVITATAIDAASKAGTGTVKVSSSAGSLSAGEELTLKDGEVTVDFTCEIAKDTACLGAITITAEWTSGSTKVTDTAQVTVGPVAVADSGAGVEDAGTEITDGGGGTGVTDAGTFAITLVSDEVKIYGAVGDSASLLANLKRGTAPVGGETVVFRATIGGVGNIDGGGGVAKVYSTVTDTAGNAAARFTDDGASGAAAISVTHTASGATTSTDVEISSVTQIQYIGTTCNGVSCTLMGVRGSGFNENAQVRFRVQDALNRPVVGLPVTFTINNQPAGTTSSPSGVTDAAGIASTNVASGRIIGAFSVRAVAITGLVETASPTIGIRGALASNNGFSISCNRVNISAYVSAQPPLDLRDDCVVKVVDRYNNPVGTGTPVNFKVEAGSITNAVNTTAYNANGNNNEEGSATVQFSTQGAFPAVDVDALPAVAGQYPFARSAEPTWQDGARTRSPRDALVSVLAYVQGEEHFNDDNNDGVRNGTEQFIDQGEPLVDSNDNGIQDANEFYIDENGNEQWDGPNGMWDASKTIWVETRILYTSASNVIPSYTKTAPSQYSGSCGTGLAKGSSIDVDVWLPDLNLNRVSVDASLGVARTTDKGTVAFQSGLLDGYGFRLERKLVDSTTEGACSTTPGSVSTRCRWKYLFGHWDTGYLGKVRAINPAGDTRPCANDIAFLSTNVRGNVSGINLTGAME